MTYRARVKFLEIRDAGTFIPAVAVDCSLTGNSFDDYLLRRAGYHGGGRLILLTALFGGRRAEYDPYAWGDRTWHVAHLYVTKHWDSIFDAEVIDVEHILGERATVKTSERYTSGEAA